MEDRENVRPARWLGVGAALLLALAAVEFLRRAWPILADPYVLNFSEGINLWAANQAHTGGTIYSDLSALPFNYYAYPPLFAWLGAIAVSVFGNGMFALRLLAVLSEVGVLVAVWRLMRRGDAPPWIATLCTALGALLLAAHRFHALARVDFTQLFLLLLSIDFVLAFLRAGGHWRLIAGGTAGVAAWLTKPTTLVTLGVCGLACLFLAFRGTSKARGRQAAIALILTAAGCGVVALVLNTATDGQFWLHTVTLQRESGFRWSLYQARVFLHTYPGLCIAGGLALVLARGRGTLRFLALASLAWWFIASFKKGADQNYNLEPLCFLVVAIGVCATRWLDGLGKTRPALALGLGIAGGAAIAIGPLLRPSDWAPSLSGAGLLERAGIHRHVGRMRDPVFVEEPFFNTVHGRRVIGSDVFQLGRLAGTKHFDPEPFLDLFRDGHFRYVICSYRLVLGMPGAKRTLETHYERMAKSRVQIMGYYWDVLQHRKWTRPRPPGR